MPLNLRLSTRNLKVKLGQPYLISTRFRHVCALNGMTLLEVLIAVLMFAVFTGVVTTVVEYTYRFLGESESGGNSVLTDHQEIQLVFDKIVDLLSQPGISMQRINQISSLRQSAPTSSCVPPLADVSVFWGLPLNKIILPSGYSLCLWKTTVPETSSKPGIYILYALPESPSSSRLPTRRLFCRPAPFCGNTK